MSGKILVHVLKGMDLLCVKGILHLLSQTSMFCAQFQNDQHFLEK